MEQKHHPIVWLGIILGGSFIVAALIAAVTIFRLRSLSDIVSVTGSAKMEVVADQAKWTTQIMRSARASTLKTAYGEIARDLDATKQFFKDQGIEETSIIISPVSMNEVYQQDQVSEKMYSLSQTLEVQSNDITKLTNASKRASDLINKNVIFSTIALEYYYSKLPEARIELLSKAIEDAKARAGELAKNSGKRVGSLKNATSGVVQVQSRNSTDVSDYGGYDTSQVDKQITVTVKAAFSLK